MKLKRKLRACLIKSERRNIEDKESLEVLKSYIASPSVANTKSTHDYYNRRIAWVAFKLALARSWLDLLECE